MTPRSETAFVLDCVRAVAAGERLRGPLPTVDWERVLRVAGANAVAPLLYHGLTVGGFDGALPADVRDRLARAYYRVAVMNARHLTELVSLLSAFERARIPVIVLKGAVLAERVWRNAALRVMADIDLLVHPSDLDRAADVLTALGYRPDVTWRPAGWYRRRHHHLPPYRKTGDWFVVEVHHDLIRPGLPLQVDVGGLWRRAEPARFGGAPAHVLAADFLLLHLCLHLAVDRPFVGRIRDLADIAVLLRQEGARLRWGRIVAGARRGGYATRLYYALASAASILSAPVDPAALAALRRAVSFGALEDRLIRVFIRRTVMADADEPARLRAGRGQAVPAWALEEACDTLLTEAPWGRKAMDLVRRLRAPVAPCRPEHEPQ